MIKLMQRVDSTFYGEMTDKSPAMQAVKGQFGSRAMSQTLWKYPRMCAKYSQSVGQKLQYDDGTSKVTFSLQEKDSAAY